MPKVNIHKNVLIAIWKFTKVVEEGLDGFIKETLKVFLTFKMKSLTKSKLDFLPKKATYNLVYKDT